MKGESMLVAVYNIGGQFNHLIYRTVMDLGEEAEMVPINTPLAELKRMGADGVIMGGGPQRIGSEMDKLGSCPQVLAGVEVPALSMCVTHQLLAIVYGGKSGPAKEPEFGLVDVFVDKEIDLLKGMAPKFRTVQSHNDEVLVLPPVMESVAHSQKCRYQVIQHRQKPIFGVQFHPETMQGEKDEQLFRNFLDICKKHKNR